MRGPTGPESTRGYVDSTGLDGTELDRTGLAAIGLDPESLEKVKKVLAEAVNAEDEAEAAVGLGWVGTV